MALAAAFWAATAVAVSIIAPPATLPAAVQVIEYYNAQLGHYFITADPVEQTGLDNGTFNGWARTGLTFGAYATTPSTLVRQVCRFYGKPQAGLDSHFYTASSVECADVVTKFSASWQLESTNVFQVQLPDLATGACQSGLVGVYRLYNNRRDVNHRYTTDAGIRQQMVAAGYISEGYGPSGVVFCVPSNGTPPPQSFSVTIVVTQRSGSTFDFSSTAALPASATVTSYTWNFGDNTSASGPAVSHTYTASGTYNVALSATSSANQTTSASRAITATVAAPPPTPTPITADFTPTMIAADTFDFDATATASTGASIVSYAWNFGDNSTAAGPHTSHRYTVSGTFPVVLTVTDSSNAVATKTKTVTANVVSAPPAGPPGSWTKYNTSYSANTEAAGQSWYNLAWDTRRNVAYGTSWSRLLSAFDPAAGRWTTVAAGVANTDGGFHNRTIAYDPVNDRVWATDGTGNALPGLQYYDFANGQWVMHSPGGPSYEAALIFDPVNKRFITFGGWNYNPLRTLSLQPVGNAWVNVNIAGGPAFTTDTQKMTSWRSTLDTQRNRIVYVDTDGSVWALPLSLSAWQHVATSGGPPPARTQYVYDAAHDALVGWSSSPRIADGDTTPGTTRETWLLPLSTLVWQKGANFASGNTVPVETVYVGYALIYDPVRQQTILHTLNGTSSYSPETWAYRYPATSSPPPVSPPPPAPGPTTAGTITSFPLPAIATAPYSSLRGSKHTNMASDGVRLYVSGGDWVTSATDGTWSMSLADGSWRQDVPAPVYPTLPAPHALQDNAGFAWVANRSKFLLWPGSYFPYDAPGSPLLNYSRGMWWFDPATRTYTQDLGLFGNPYPSNANSTGSPFGGVYDEVNGQIVEFGDSSTGFACRRWDVNTDTRLPDLPFNLTRPSGYAAYFTRTMHVKVGRYVYILGYRTNGNVSSQTPLFMRWHLDNRTMEELAAPAVDGTQIKDIEVRMGTSHGKIVWPFTTGPDGEIHNIYVYNPTNNTWYQDTQVPSYGNFIGNAVTSLPDGRVVWSGGEFGRPQTHIWFYEAN